MDSYLISKIDGKILSKGDMLDAFYTAIIKPEKTVLFSFVNPYSYTRVLSLNIINSVDYWGADGQLFCFLYNIFNRNKSITRSSFDFSSIANSVFRSAELNKKKVGLIGGSHDDIQAAVLFIKRKYRDLDIVYYRHGYNLRNELPEISNCIVKNNCEILILGLGTPLQEEVGIYFKNNRSCNILFTCGAFISQTGNKGDYFYPLVKKLGLRWFQRAYMHSYVRRRLLVDYPLFVFNYTLTKLKNIFVIKKDF